MADVFKKLLNTGVGLASLTADKVQQTIEALVREGKLSEQEGGHIIENLKRNGETKRRELEKQAQGIAAGLLKTVGVDTEAAVEEVKRAIRRGTRPDGPPGPAAKPAPDARSGNGEPA